jgi:hypothetical protein
MSITQLKLYENITCHKSIDVGELYFFENFVVAEFKEGVNLSFDTFNEARIAIKEQFGSNDFGFIGNRINSYSILVTDGPSFNEEFKNLKAYAVVSHSFITEKIFEIENHFFNFNRKSFTSLEDAVVWVELSLKKVSEAN